MWDEQSLVLLAVAPLLTFAALIVAMAAVASIAPIAAVALLAPAAVTVVVASMFWSATIVAAANEVAEQRSPTVAGSVRAAAHHLPAICGWAFVSLSVGVLLRVFGAALGRLGMFVTYSAETAWSVATMVVLPAIVVDGATAAEAQRRSRERLGSSWATRLTGQLGFDLVAAAAVVPALAFVVVAALLDNGPLMGFALLLCVAVFIAAALAASACLSVYRTMLYRSVTGRSLPEAFDFGDISSAPAAGAARTTIATGSRPVASS
jgi:hypothetical protein